MARAGRKLKLTDTVTRDITAALSIGATIEIACAYAAVSPDSYYNWMRKAKEALAKLEADPDAKLTSNEKRYVQFFNKVEESQAWAAVGWLQVINESAERSPEWCKWLLKVRYPEGYSEVQKQEITGRDGGPVEMHTVNTIIVREYVEDDDEGD